MGYFVNLASLPGLAGLLALLGVVAGGFGGFGRFSELVDVTALTDLSDVSDVAKSMILAGVAALTRVELGGFGWPRQKPTDLTGKGVERVSWFSCPGGLLDTAFAHRAMDSMVDRTSLSSRTS